MKVTKNPETLRAAHRTADPVLTADEERELFKQLFPSGVSRD